MDNTFKINLGGYLFQIDEEAFKILRGYLQEIDIRLRKTQGGSETIDDIESRIAEIFRSQKNNAGVLTKDNVAEVISIIGRPEDFDISADEAEVKDPLYFSDVQKKLYRNPDDTIISGVCGGIGAYLNIESVWIRILFILFTCFFGIGFFVYIALWIALPSAYSDAQKKEMYGTGNLNAISRKGNTDKMAPAGSDYSPSRRNVSLAGNAFNEIFRAIGKVLFIIVRIVLIFIGVSFVIAGFVALISFIMVFFFKYPGYFSTHSFGFNLFYLPDFLNYIVNPAIAPWILILAFIVILMPLLALIYWGIKMILWFKARDAIFALAGLVIWVMSIAALSLILFNEGISFAETANAVTRETKDKTPEELYIVAQKKISDLNYDKEITLPDEKYQIYLNDENKGLYIGTSLTINKSEDNSLAINIKKRSAGRSRPDAARKAGDLVYNYKISSDTIYLDEYFIIPEGNKWSCDNVGVNLLRSPGGTTVHFDSTTLNMFNDYNNGEWHSESDDETYINTDKPWEMTENGLRPKPDKPVNK